MKTWNDIKNFDDIIFDEQKEIIKDLEKNSNSMCPHCKKEGLFFYYCGKNTRKTKDKTPNLEHPIYQNHVSILELSLYCFNNFKECSYFKEEII
mgnify:FL=1